MRRLGLRKKQSAPPVAGRISRTTLRRKGRVLLVEDHDDTRVMYAEHLRRSGWEVEDVTNGLEALHVARSFAPDVIVMDLSLPELDGVEAIRRLRHDTELPRMPILAVTAHPSKDHEAIAAGCDVVFLKPCAPADLARAIKRALAATRDS